MQGRVFVPSHSRSREGSPYRQITVRA
jgi:hypothetical protein